AAPTSPERAQLMATLDRLNGRFGQTVVGLAAAGWAKGANHNRGPAWAGRAAYRSPLYTTSWEGLWQVS
ncbi:DUF4113 domain-containing protein, partial [Hymenobacter agri]